MSRPAKPAASPSLTRHPPAYRALRMAAEWSSAVRDRQLDFAYDGDTGHMVLEDAGRGPTLPVLTRSFTSRPLVKEVEFSVRSGTVGTEIAPPTLRVSGDQVSALFWSESAVEKFLVPFYASVAGDDAPRFLGRLFDAWYGYPADVVQVCAVACLLGRQPPPAGTPLSLARTVGLVCLEGGSRLTLLTLDEFTERYATGMPRGGEAVTLQGGPAEVRHGWEVTARMESVVARDVAEFVSGMRGHFVAFSTEEETLVPVVYPDASPRKVVGGALFGALARPVRPDRPVPVHVVLHVDGTDGAPIVQTLIPGGDGAATEFVPDSLFWTDGAVETLLVPYYASVKGGDAWLFEGFLMGKWDGLIKPASSSPDDLVGAVTQRLHRLGHAAGRGAEDPLPSPVYATMHLPRSEYADMASRTMVLWEQPGKKRGTRATSQPMASPVWPGQGDAAPSPANRSRKTASRATEARKAGRSAR